jgi:uncharacterized membrane protein YfcA
LNLWFELICVAFAAGMVDAVMGGGGMLQVPAMFAVFPGVAPAMLLGTNKFAGLIGTAGAAWRYARALPPRWSTVGPVVIAAFVASALGAFALTRVPAEPLRKALPFLLLALLVYTALSRAGTEHLPRHARDREAAVAAAGATAVGFYDGFFGPGAGAFYKMLFVRTLGFDFLNSAAPAKFANVASNAAAVIVFAAKGLLLWKVAAVMAVANLAGGQVGSRIALRYGNRLMRWAFLIVVAVLIVKTFSDAYLQPQPISGVSPAPPPLE